ncbi:MAG: VTT domain-containing protein [Luteolibacter sp.]
MATLKKILSDRRFHRLAGVMTVLAVGAGLFAWKLGVDVAMLKSAWNQAEEFLKLHPWWLFGGLVILPAFPVPTSALLLLAGTVWRDRPLMACAICLLAMALNMSWTYWVAARPGRGLVVKLLDLLSLRVPELPQGNHLRMILLVRLTPGFPFFIQNYLLGFFRVPFRHYLPVSVGCNGMISVGIVLSAAGAADGNLVPVLTGVGLIAVGLVVVQWVRTKMLKTEMKTGM